MVSYVNDLRLSELATGEGSGTWGTTTNTNLELIGEAFSFGTEAITTNADTHTTTIADGSTDPGRSMFLKYTGTLDSTCTITIGPNTVSKLWFIENATSGSQSIIIKQGSGATVTIANGQTKAIYSDGAGSGGAMVDAFQDLSVPDFFIEDDLTFTSDSAVITFGADGDTTLTHTDGSGLTLNSTNKIMFNDASQFIQGSSATVLSLGATDEIDLTATAIDVNGTMDVSGSLTGTTAVFTTDGNTTQLSLISTDEDENVGPRLDLRRDSASPAANDSLGTLRFMGKDSASGNFAYAFLQGFIVDPTDGSEDGKLLIETRLAGVNKERISMDATELVINENSMDLDFRVESDNNTHALFVQGSDSSVGVGTNSPAKTLQVSQGANATATTIRIENTDTSIDAAQTTNAIEFYTNDSSTGGTGVTGKISHIAVNAGSTYALAFSSYNGSSLSEAMRIDSLGNVGIGKVPEATNSGYISLDVALANLMARTSNTDFYLTSNSYFSDAWRYTTSAAATQYYQSGGEHVWRRATSSTTADGTVNNSGNWDESMRIDASGNVLQGITAIPTGVQSSRQLISSSATGAEIIAYREDNAVAVDDFVGAFLIGHDDNSGTEDHFIGMWGEATSSNGNMNLKFAAGRDVYETGGTHMMISSSGRVLIGTTSGTYTHDQGLRVRSGEVGSHVLDAALSLEGSGGDFYAMNMTGPSNIGFGVLAVFSGTTDYVIYQYRDSSGSTNIIQLLQNGNVVVLGALSKGSGSFRIDHPLPAKTSTHHLVHSFIEGPQADLIYRGKVTLVDGSATVNVDTAAGMTEGTFEVLCTDVQCFTSNESGWTAVKGSVSGNTLTITAQDNTCTDTISWMVVGERKDQHMLDTDWTDDNGKVIVEPLKEND
jgi:hypothetical protein